MVKLCVRPTLNLSEKQEASGGVKATMSHGNADWSVSITDGVARGGDVMDGLCLGMRLHDGSLEARYEPGSGHHLLRTQHAVNVRDKTINVRMTDIAASERATHINCTMAVDANNSARVIYRCNPGNRLDHRNATVGWVYRKDDWEIEPRYNLGTDSLSAGVTYAVDVENSVRAIYDMGTNEGRLTWINTGALGGGGQTRLDARMRMDKDNVQQPTIMVSKNWDLDL